jgi:CHASE2 domain-containing sensor protein
VAADGVIAGGKGSIAGRRPIAVVAMLAGALGGAAFVVAAHIVYPLVTALIVLLIIAVTSWRLGTS